MRLLFFVLLFLGTSVSAQSVDQRKLSKCITEANEILEFADAWRQTLEAKGERARPWDTASFYRIREMQQVVGDALVRLEAKEAHEDILKAIEIAAEPILLREDLIEAMIKEAYDKSGEYDEIAVFISQCATNYGGELFTLEDEIAELRKQLGKLKNDNSELTQQKDALEANLNTQIRNLRTMLSNNKINYEKRLKARRDDMIAPYKKRIKTLCNGMRAFNHNSFLTQKVYVNNEFYNLCD